MIDVPAFTVNLTIQRGTVQRGTSQSSTSHSRTSDVRLRVQLTSALPWSKVHPHVCRAADLPEGSPLFLGIGVVEPNWLVGHPPLLTGTRLTTQPGHAIRVRAPLALCVIAGPDAGRQIAIGAHPIVIGRGPDATLPLTDLAVSRRHALLTPVANGVAVTDIGSVNGVLVDGCAVGSDPMTAQTGSVLRVGSSLLQIQLTTEPLGDFRADGQGCAIRIGRPSGRSDALPPVPEKPTAPEPPTRRALPYVSVIIGAVLGAGLAIALRNPMFLAFAAFGPAMMIGSAMSDRIHGRRSYRRQLRDYRKALSAWEQASAACANAIRLIAWRRWPGPAELLRHASGASARLWDHPASPDGLLRVCIGFGSRQYSSSSAPSGTALTVSDVAATVTLVDVIGFVGERARGTARFVVAQLACQHSPADLSIRYVGIRSDFAGCADLPHAITGGPAPSRCVVILDGPAAITSSAGQAALISGGNIVVIALADEYDDLPSRAIAIDALPVDVNDVGLTAMSSPLLNDVIRALAPLRDRTGGGASTGASLPADVNFADLAGAIEPTAVTRRWARPSTTAVLGMDDHGSVEFDLASHGPHVLIAGTTGSGKSELLQTLIASLVLAAPPTDLTLLLVDYKGGSAFGPITALPHVVGVLTDLDPATSARALTSLRAELQRRERVAADGGPRPARLVLVIDEFATLATELPEFLAGVLDIAQRGRSLGLHLVLATQRPAGVVSPAMRANISARICLRVTDSSDSVDVIGIPDAAALPADRPGRAILRTGDRTVTFQAARVTVPIPQPVMVTRIGGRAGDANLAAGGGNPSVAHATSSAATRPQDDTIDMRGDLIAATRIAAAGLPPPMRPWLAPLPRRIPAPSDRPGLLGLADIPSEQRQEELAAPEASALVIGPPGSGRSTALRRLARAAAVRGEELFVIDGGGQLADLRTWPEVSSYLTHNDARLVLRLLTLLGDRTARPLDGRFQRIIVDHYDLVVAELERADYVAGSGALPDVEIRSGGRVRLVASGPDRLLHHRSAHRFTEIIHLGGANGTEPGRAEWRGTTVQVFDDAIPTGQSETGQSDSARSPWPDPLIVRPLPTECYADELEDPTKEAPGSSGMRVALGIGGDAAAPVWCDLDAATGGLVIIGPRGSGVSSTLDALARRTAALGVPVFRLHVGTSAVPQDRAAHGASGGAEQIIRDVDCRDGGANLATLLAIHEGPLMVMANLRGGAAGDHPAAAVLDRYLEVCGPGQILAVGVRPDTLQRARRGYLRIATQCRQGLLLHPDPLVGDLFEVAVPKHAGPLIPGRGLWLWGGAAIPLQFALPTQARQTRGPL